LAVAGDSNLDGIFDAADLIMAMSAGLYETGKSAQWADGDWNLDGRFDSADMRYAFSEGKYDQPHHLELPHEIVRPPQNSNTEDPGFLLSGDSRFFWNIGQHINVWFMDGTRNQRTQVQTHAATWEQYANIHFEFSTPNAANADISITFNCNGNSSMLGTASVAVARSGNASMCLSSVMPGADTVHVRRTVLHEFGHALGMGHEHQRLDAGLAWNINVIVNDLGGAPNKWSMATIRSNLLDPLSQNYTNFSSYDPKSIMHYYIPSRWTMPGIEIPQPTELSANDKTFIGRVYPFLGKTLVGQFDRNGRDDLARFAASDGAWLVGLSVDSNFSVREWANFSTNSGWTSQLVGDFNGDGRDDIANFHPSNGSWWVALSNGTAFRVREWRYNR
jgi:hypothetical protein